eukprot:TRINITY_DN8493_c0_g1_i4.p1 TRINITY_DN8493_c0_g1~~TRINITY_DN8493_c0_g1_i4.p1  ORF type:complete len:313 (-),score=18.06 TRINITY_DN8493_c0_g1_i4:120-1058(-)
MGVCFSQNKKLQPQPDDLPPKYPLNHVHEFHQTPSESSTQPTLTESVVQSVGAGSDVGSNMGTNTRRPSSSLMMIHEGRQESFHSIYSHASFASAFSKFSDGETLTPQQTPRSTLNKRPSGKEAVLRQHHEGIVPTDHIPNDEIKPFWQPMSIHQNPVGDSAASIQEMAKLVFQIVGHKIDVRNEKHEVQTIGSEESLSDQPFNVSVQGMTLQESIIFRISQPIEQLTCIKKVTKGVMQYTLTENMGDFQPGDYIYEFPESYIPKGPFSRGLYHEVTTFVDVHGEELFTSQGDFKVIKQEGIRTLNNGMQSP